MFIFDHFNLNEKIVLITGGEGFLGKMIHEVTTELGGIPKSIDIVGNPDIRCDLTDPIAIRNMSRELGKVDILVNNAVGNQKPVDNAADGWDNDIAIGLIAAFHMVEALRDKLSVVLNIGSDLGLVGPDQSLYPPWSVKPASYSVVKHGIIGLTRYLAATYPDIRCNCLCPGGVDQGQPVPKNILGRNARLEEMKGPVAFLLSDASSFMTGSILTVDGGRTCL
jgi:NAD(P)-dependent dehydrogenase (short-subunit alcohol dehydrogenase family)